MKCLLSKRGVARQNFLLGHASGQIVKDDGYHDPGPFDAGTTVADCWVY